MTDKALLKMVAGFRKGILGKKGPKLMCYAVSSPLEPFLRMAGVKSALSTAAVLQGQDLWQHYFLILEDGRILDATASQFTDPSGLHMPTIYLGPRPSWYQEFKNNKKTSRIININI